MNQHSIPEKTLNTEGFLYRQSGFRRGVQFPLVQPQRRNPSLSQRKQMLHSNRGQLITVDRSAEELERFQPCQFKGIRADSIESAFQFECVGLKWQRLSGHHHQRQTRRDVLNQLLKQGDGCRIGDGANVINHEHTVAVRVAPVSIGQ